MRGQQTDRLKEGADVSSESDAGGQQLEAVKAPRALGLLAPASEGTGLFLLSHVAPHLGLDDRQDVLQSVIQRPRTSTLQPVLLSL
jgi:hypothetical protein